MSYIIIEVTQTRIRHLPARLASVMNAISGPFSKYYQVSMCLGIKISLCNVAIAYLDKVRHETVTVSGKIGFAGIRRKGLRYEKGQFS